MKMTTNNIPQGYKDSPLGIIPEEWEVKKLREIAEINPTRKDFISPFVTFLSMADISEHGGILKENIVPQNSIKPGLTSFKRGDIIIAKITPCFENGKGALLNNITNEYGFGSTEFHVIRCKQCNLFIYYHTMSYAFRKRLESQMTGSAGQKRVPADSISSYKIPVPPLSEQQKIAEVLSTWDKAIEKQSQLIEKLELRKKGLMQQLLTGKKRLPGFSSEWKTMKLGELFDERNETNMPALPLLSITANKGIILQTESEKKNTSNDDKSKYKRICPNDIGYNTMRMWQGRCALSKLEGIVSPAYTIIIPHNNINPYYMEMLFKQPFMVYRFWTHSQGLVNDTLNCKFPSFSQVKVIIPDLKEQNAIIEILLSCDTEITLANQRFESLRQQKKGLMQVLLIGKNRVIR